LQPVTKFEKLGDSPFKQWFRISLMLVLVYWLASWGESMMTPGDPHFDPIASSEAELNDFKQMDNMTEEVLVSVMVRLDPNITILADIEALDKNITQSVEDEEASVAKTVTDDASEMWLGKSDDLDEVSRVADFPEIARAMPDETVSPAQQFFATLKWLTGVVWLGMVVMLRAHTRQRFAIPAKCCACKLCGNLSCEDIWCTLCCQPCVLSQMATHSGAVTDGEGCNPCDQTDPGESEHIVLRMEATGAPQPTNSMEEKGAMV